MSTLSDLEAWYAGHCNGDWEHARGIHVETIDNPGWMLRVDLAGTELADRPFEAIVTAGDADAWMDARVVGGVWQAACGPGGLERAIETFLRWAREAPGP